MVDKERLYWIDEIKVFACLLVVLGHFFQSMTKSGVLRICGWNQWFDQTIYYFHVQLFFVCSGYLFQKYGRVYTLDSWKKNMLKKALNLGVPYFTFSFITWILKLVFATSTNDQAGGLVDTLFFHPASPYWYLYCLFFIFLVTPTFKNRRTVTYGLTVAIILKIIYVIGLRTMIYAVSAVMSNEIWFIVGMYLCLIDISQIVEKVHGMLIGEVAGICFLILSILIYRYNVYFPGMKEIMTIIAIIAVLMVTITVFNKRMQRKALTFFTQYTMPIFLMHTLFAAALRSILLKLSINSTAIHLVLGIGISIVGPIIVAMFMRRIGWLEFFLYPEKVLKAYGVRINKM